MSGQGTSKSKKKHGNENSSGSSSSAHNQTSKRGQVYNTANVGLDVLANIAEGSDILAPLKAACRTTQSILGVVQAIENNQQEWVDLIQRLKDYTSALEERIVLIEAYPVEGRAIDKAVRQPLVHYVEFLQTMHDTVINLQAKRDRKRGFFKSFSKMKIDAGEILKLNRDIEERHRHLIEALGVFTAVHVQVIEESTKVIEESSSNRR
ncbi:hypothetical protein PIIN_11218 [Serendipita indica DSM 11827]|uniref:Uncharacterized protein n=1 Tax=Serendipita indica (strain DSM 11827) TaxID=1109443 RepID=G4U0Z2_SERID|nr:hypothetical protein PIIN_11218 [Serendipita indica DSM 11827]